MHGIYKVGVEQLELLLTEHGDVHARTNCISKPWAQVAYHQYHVRDQCCIGSEHVSRRMCTCCRTCAHGSHGPNMQTRPFRNAPTSCPISLLLVPIQPLLDAQTHTNVHSCLNIMHYKK